MKGIPHLFHNEELSFDDIYNLIISLSTGDIPVFDKIDGVNVFVTFEGQFKVAKNKGQLLSGGLSADHVREAYDGHPICSSLVAVITTLSALFQGYESEAAQVFGNGQKWFNFEVVDTKNPNVFRYEKDMLALHANGHLEVVEGSLSPLEAEEDLYVLAALMGGGKKHGPFMPFVRDARVTSMDQDLMSSYLHRVKAFRSNHVPDRRPVAEHFIQRLSERVSKDFPGVSYPICELIASKIYGNKVKLKEITRHFPRGDKGMVKEYLKDKTHLSKLREGYQSLLEGFGADLIRENPSEMLPENSQELVLQDLVEGVADFFQKHGTDEEIEEIDDLFEQIGEPSDVPCHEGFVMEYKGETYKVTGKFPKVNKLIWKKRKRTGGGPKVGVFPGKFKPPHLGHWGQVQEMLDMGLDKVIVLISPVSSGGISPEDSKAIWEVYAKGDHRVIPQISRERSPVREAYGVIGSLQEQSVAYVACGKKDNNRFKEINEWAKENLTRIAVERVMGIQNEKGITGSSMRESLLNKDRRKFFEGMPSHVSDREKRKIWESLQKGS